MLLVTALRCCFHLGPLCPSELFHVLCCAHDSSQSLHPEIRLPHSACICSHQFLVVPNWISKEFVPVPLVGGFLEAPQHPYRPPHFPILPLSLTDLFKTVLSDSLWNLLCVIAMIRVTRFVLKPLGASCSDDTWNVGGAGTTSGWYPNARTSVCSHYPPALGTKYVDLQGGVLSHLCCFPL